MAPTGQATIARRAPSRSSESGESGPTGCRATKAYPGPSENTSGANCRQASQSMHEESTNQGPTTFPASRFFGSAINQSPGAPPPGVALRRHPSVGSSLFVRRRASARQTSLRPAATARGLKARQSVAWGPTPRRRAPSASVCRVLTLRSAPGTPLGKLRCGRRRLRAG